jgi:hypothetical protein
MQPREIRSNYPCTCTGMKPEDRKDLHHCKRKRCVRQGIREGKKTRQRSGVNQNERSSESRQRPMGCATLHTLAGKQPGRIEFSASAAWRRGRRCARWCCEVYRGKKPWPSGGRVGAARDGEDAARDGDQLMLIFFPKDSSPNASGPGGRRFTEDGDKDMVTVVLGLGGLWKTNESEVGSPLVSNMEV